MTIEAVETAINRAGSVKSFAQAHEVTRQAVELWLKRGHMPFDRATQTEVLFSVPRESLVSPRIAAAYLTPAAGDDLL